MTRTRRTWLVTLAGALLFVAGAKTGEREPRRQLPPPQQLQEARKRAEEARKKAEEERKQREAEEKKKQEEAKTPEEKPKPAAPKPNFEQAVAKLNPKGPRSRKIAEDAVREREKIDALKAQLPLHHKRLDLKRQIDEARRSRNSREYARLVAEYKATQKHLAAKLANPAAKKQHEALLNEVRARQAREKKILAALPKARQVDVVEALVKKKQEEARKLAEEARKKAEEERKQRKAEEKKKQEKAKKKQEEARKLAEKARKKAQERKQREAEEKKQEEEKKKEEEQKKPEEKPQPQQPPAKPGLISKLQPPLPAQPIPMSTCAKCGARAVRGGVCSACGYVQPVNRLGEYKDKFQQQKKPLTPEEMLAEAAKREATLQKQLAALTRQVKELEAQAKGTDGEPQRPGTTAPGDEGTAKEAKAVRDWRQAQRELLDARLQAMQELLEQILITPCEYNVAKPTGYGAPQDCIMRLLKAQADKGFILAWVRSSGEFVFRRPKDFDKLKQRLHEEAESMIQARQEKVKTLAALVKEESSAPTPESMPGPKQPSTPKTMPPPPPLTPNRPKLPGVPVANQTDPLQAESEQLKALETRLMHLHEYVETLLLPKVTYTLMPVPAGADAAKMKATLEKLETSARVKQWLGWSGSNAKTPPRFLQQVVGQTPEGLLILMRQPLPTVDAAAQPTPAQPQPTQSQKQTEK